jgi:hypothetical protein
VVTTPPHQTGDTLEGRLAKEAKRLREQAKQLAPVPSETSSAKRGSARPARM